MFDHCLTWLRILPEATVLNTFTLVRVTAAYEISIWNTEAAERDV